MGVIDIKNLFLCAWSKETCVPSQREEWSKDNPSLGQCAITALIINDIFGGKIMRCMSQSGSHYYNLINNNIVDFTVEQFLGVSPEYEHAEIRTREYLLSNEDTKKRYILLTKNLNQAIEKINGEIQIKQLKKSLNIKDFSE